MNQKVFQQIWDQLRGKKGQFREFLEEVSIKELRGISNLSVRFSFPVTVLAGPNACGKSTVLFACACAYHVPGSGTRDYVPTTLFPCLKNKSNPELSDYLPKTAFEFYYIHDAKRMSMRWAKGKSWNRSFMGKGGEQPQRPLYFRTLANLASPSEVRSVLQIASGNFTSHTITSDLIAFAQRILPMQFQEVVLISKNNKDLLFVKRQDAPNTKYSEFHMSAGERAIIRISKEISNLRNAMVLIDEIEAGIHPYTQQQLMLELQRLALRNDLQIIVTTHSPVILDCVPVEARIFLERLPDNVIIRPAYKDIIQKAFYGQSLEKLSILCEDEIGESFILGVLDVLNPKIGLMHDDLKVGRDTGKEEFANHIVAISKFQQLDNFIFILDGDAKNLENDLLTTAKETGNIIQPLFLPGDVPERWAWKMLQTYTNDYSVMTGHSPIDIQRIMHQQDQLYDNAADSPSKIMKNKFFSFCEILKQTHTELMRKIARKEAERLSPDMNVFMQSFENLIRAWQNRK